MSKRRLCAVASRVTRPISRERIHSLNDVAWGGARAENFCCKKCVWQEDLIKTFFCFFLASSIDILWPFTAHKNSFTLEMLIGRPAFDFPPCFSKIDDVWTVLVSAKRHWVYFSRAKFCALRNSQGFARFVWAPSTTPKSETWRLTFCSLPDLYRNSAAKMTTVQIQRKRKFHSLSRFRTITTFASELL